LLSEVLLGMGLTHFSMAPSSILKTRKTIRSTSFENARQKAKAVLELPSGQDIQTFLKNNLIL
jgi:phosphoenolpyruvate-protein phosphotransferase (PTS system enzyme I)